MNSAIVALLVVTVWVMSKGRILDEGTGEFIRNSCQPARAREA